MKIAALTILFAALVAADGDSPGPDPTQVYIKNISYGGSGCPNGSVGKSVSDDRKTFTLIFDQFIASLGPGVPITENRKNCQINMDISYPQGWQYTLLSSTYRGYAQLDGGVTGTHKSTYYFAGETKQCSTSTEFVGPTSRDYLVNNEVEIASQIWSACNKVANLNINSQVRMASRVPSASGQLTNDSQDGKFEQLLALSWRPCHH